MALDPLIGFGLLSGVGSLASGLMGQGMSYEQSKDLMNYQYQLQQEAIDRQNLYNSPAEQMKRLASAQLNPNLVYGSGVDGNQSSAASPGIANRNVRLDNPLQDMGTAYLQSKQLQMQQIAARNEAFESRARRLNLEAKTLGVLSDNKLKDATLNSNIRMAATKLANEAIKGDLMQEQVNNLKIQANNLIEQGNLLAARTGLTQEQGLTEVVKRRALEKGIELKDAQIRQIAHMIPYIDAGKDLRDLQYDIQDLGFESSNELEKWLKDHPNAQFIDAIIDHVADKVNKMFGGNGSPHRKRNKTRKRN